MKVLLANKFFFLNGGSETVFFQERDFLLRCGVKVVDFSMQDPRNFSSPHADYFVPNITYDDNANRSELPEPVRKWRTAINFVHNREAVKRLSSLIEREKPDIAHLHNIYHQLTPSIIRILKNAGVKVVLTLHDYKLLCPTYSMLKRGEICDACRGKHFFHTTIKKCQDSSISKSLLLSIEAYWHKWLKSYEGVDLFLAPSQFMANLVTQSIVNSKRVRVLPNGIDLENYKPAGDRGDYMLYAGRISKEKGIETLIRAYQLRPFNLPLKIVGTGPLLEKLRVKYPEVEFTGYKRGEELNKLFQNAAFVIIPSQCYENCSMSVLEAMAYGKPVVASQIGGIPEQVEHGKTGLLFEAGNAEALAICLNALAENLQLQKSLGSAGRKKVETSYSLESHCHEMLGVYQDLL